MKKIFVSMLTLVSVFTLSAQITADVTLRLESQSGSVSELYLFAGPDLATTPERGSLLPNTSNPEDINVYVIDATSGKKYSSYGNEDLENVFVGITTSKEAESAQHYTFRFEVYENAEILKLKDLVTGEEVEIVNGGSYAFEVNSSNAPEFIEGTYSAINQRFVINYAPVVKELEVIYQGKDNVIWDQEDITLHMPVVPIFDGFTFQGWFTVAGPIEDGIILQAVYTSNDPTNAPEVVVNPANPSQKLVRNGQVYILRDNTTYSLQGQMIK